MVISTNVFGERADALEARVAAAEKDRTMNISDVRNLIGESRLLSIGNAVDKPWTHREEFYLIMILGPAVLIFLAIMLGWQLFIIQRAQRGWTDTYLKAIGLTLLVGSGLFVIVTAYTQEQAAPLFGLLGALAGYLLGKDFKTRGPDGNGDAA